MRIPLRMLNSSRRSGTHASTERTPARTTNNMTCAALICTAGCPATVTERLAESLPNICFDCYATEVTHAQNICPYKDIYLLISAEDIIGIEEDWLNTASAFKGVSLKARNVFIQTYENEFLSPDWQALLTSFTSRGAVPALLEPAQTHS